MAATVSLQGLDVDVDAGDLGAGGGQGFGDGAAQAPGGAGDNGRLPGKIGGNPTLRCAGHGCISDVRS